MTFQQRKTIYNNNNGFSTAAPSYLPPVSNGQSEGFDLPNFAPRYYSNHPNSTAAPPQYHGEDFMSRSSSMSSSLGDEGATFQAASCASTPMKKRGSSSSLRLPSMSSFISSTSSTEYTHSGPAAPPSTPIVAEPPKVKAHRWEPYNIEVVTIRCRSVEDKMVQQLLEAARLEELDEIEADLQWLHYQEEATAVAAPPPSPVTVGPTALTTCPSPMSTCRSVKKSDTKTKIPSTKQVTTEKFSEEAFKSDAIKKKHLFRTVPCSYSGFEENRGQREKFLAQKKLAMEQQKKEEKDHSTSSRPEPLSSDYCWCFVKLRRQSEVIRSSRQNNTSLPLGFTADESALDWVTYRYYRARSRSDVPVPGDVMVTTIPGFKNSTIKTIVEDAFRMRSCFRSDVYSTQTCRRFVDHSVTPAQDAEIVELTKSFPARLSRLELQRAQKVDLDLDMREKAFNLSVFLTLDLLELVDVELSTPAPNELNEKGERKNKELTVFYREKADAAEVYNQNKEAFCDTFVTKSDSDLESSDVINTQCIAIHLNKSIQRSMSRFVAVRLVHVGEATDKTLFQ